MIRFAIFSLTLIKNIWNTHFCLWKCRKVIRSASNRFDQTWHTSLSFIIAQCWSVEHMTWWTANKTTAWQKEKVFFVCKISQMGNQRMQCMDNIALACKLHCISLHALKSSAHAVTCAHHICGFTFNCRFIRCMIFWEITPELIVFDASLRVFALCVLTALVDEAACTCLSVYSTLVFSSGSDTTLCREFKRGSCTRVCVCRIVCTHISFIQHNSASWH